MARRRKKSVIAIAIVYETVWLLATALICCFVPLSFFTTILLAFTSLTPACVVAGGLLEMYLMLPSTAPTRDWWALPQSWRLVILVPAMTMPCVAVAVVWFVSCFGESYAPYPCGVFSIAANASGLVFAAVQTKWRPK